MLGVVLWALSVELIADRYDPGIVNQPHPRDRSRSWFVREMVSQLEPTKWLPWEKRRLDAAICEMCEALVEKNLATKNGCQWMCPKK